MGQVRLTIERKGTVRVIVLRADLAPESGTYKWGSGPKWTILKHEPIEETDREYDQRRRASWQQEVA